QVACAPFKIMLSEDAREQISDADTGGLPFHAIHIAVKHQAELVRAFEFNPMADKPEALARAEHAYLRQLGVKPQEARYNIRSGPPT
ncbi:hypothetical protein ACXYUI_29405, partial [Klebsiella pneumoniae]